MHFIYFCSQDMSLDSEGRQRGGGSPREKGARGVRVAGKEWAGGREAG